MKTLITMLLIILVTVTAGWSQDNLENYTYQLTQSTQAYQIWTTLPSERVFKDDALPTATGSGVKVYAAKNEFEPFIIVVKPAASGSVTVSVGNFGSGIIAELYQVKYVNLSTASDSLGRTGDYPDPLWPLESGASVSLTAGENTAFWISLQVPSNTSAGDYPANVSIGGVTIPVNLHVFDFAIPNEVHTKSQMNFSHETVLTKYSVTGTGAEYWFYVDKMKQYFMDHRLTAKGPLWSGGLTTNGASPYIDYDCNGTFTDNDGDWGFETPAAWWLDGAKLANGVGFPSFMAMTFRNNDASADQRPDSFCGQTRTTADWYTAANPASAYNQMWFQYVAAVEDYLDDLGYLDKSYYYLANEPQDQADYDAVAWYSQELKKAAPNLKLMVSEEPKPEIYDHPTFTGSKIDIWLPVLNNFDPEVSADRAKNHGEETWIYFLYGTKPPYFNPITLDHPGIESKFTGWFLWKYRLRGLAYYSLNNWSANPWTSPMTDGQNGNTFMLYPPAENNLPITYGSNNHRFVPSIRFELMRDSLEDYEYLYLLAGGSQPQVDVTNAADYQAGKIISSTTSYTRDSSFMYNLRRLIGLKIGGEIAAIPDIQPPPAHPRAQGRPGNYYLNFQDPGGEPTADPLIVDSHEYMKIGWNEYPADPTLGYGWYGDMAHVMSAYATSGPNVLQRSILYDDWGRQKVFEFDLPNGDYLVTVSTGWQGRTYSHNYVEVEGVVFIDDEAASPYLVRTKLVKIRDHKLTMNMGIFGEYTMLNYMDIEAVHQANPAVYLLLLDQ